MEKKQQQSQKVKKILAAILAFCLIFMVNLLVAESGAMSYVAKAGMKLQHLLDGQKKTFADSSNREEHLVTKNRFMRQPLDIHPNMLEYDSLCIAVKTGTFGRKNKGEFTLEFRQGDYVERKQIDVSELEDNTYVRLSLDCSKMTVGEAMVSCYSDSDEGSAITVICTDQCVFHDFFYINEDPIDEKNMKMNVYVPFG